MGGMMAFGPFVFELATAPYQEYQHERGWRHPSNSRVGKRPARQFLGPDDESVSLSGVLYREIMPDAIPSLDTLRDLGDSGAAYALIDGEGNILGQFILESFKQTRTEFFDNGVPRKIEFSLALKRVDDERGIQ